MGGSVNKGLSFLLFFNKNNTNTHIASSEEASLRLYDRNYFSPLRPALLPTVLEPNLQNQYKNSTGTGPPLPHRPPPACPVCSRGSEIGMAMTALGDLSGGGGAAGSGARDRGDVVVLAECYCLGADRSRWVTRRRDRWWLQVRTECVMKEKGAGAEQL